MSAPASSPVVTIVDAFPDGQRLVTAGVHNFSRALSAAVSGQIEASTAELHSLERATALVGDLYASVELDTRGAVALLRAHKDAALALQPHAVTVDALEGVVSELEEAARTIDSQTRALESLFATLLREE